MYRPFYTYRNCTVELMITKEEMRKTEKKEYGVQYKNKND